MQVQGEDNSAPSTPTKPQQLSSLDGTKPYPVQQLPEQTQQLQVDQNVPEEQQQVAASTQLNTSTQSQQSSSASQGGGGSGQDERETEAGVPTASESDATSWNYSCCLVLCTCFKSLLGELHVHIFYGFENL